MSNDVVGTRSVLAELLGDDLDGLACHLEDLGREEGK